MKPKLQIVLLVTCLFGAVSVAAPSKIEGRHEYATSLNSIAFIVMGWYGSLIENDDNELGGNAVDFYFDTENIESRWQQYRSKYPLNITQVLITHTQLLELNDEYQFNVNSKISYKNSENEIQTEVFEETFVFLDTLTSQSQTYIPSLKNISLLGREEIASLDAEGYHREHYKVREFVYAWLSYMDGLSFMTQGMNGDEWLDQASYTLQIGADITQGSVEEVFLERKEMLANGGHLLRELDVVKSSDSDNIFIVNIALDWKGFDASGNPVIANVHQELKIKIAEDNSWSVIAVYEKHLLPFVGPWMGLLC